MNPPLPFSYHRAVAPMMWVLVALASGELIVVHTLVALWSRWAALILSVLTLCSALWLVSIIAGFRRSPVLLTEEALIMRSGRLIALCIPLTDIAGLRAEWDGAAVKQRSVLNLALIAYPNIVVDLAAPRPGRRAISAIAHRLDEPDAFKAALAEALGQASTSA